MTFNPTVLSAVPNQELRWLGHLYIAGPFDGEHSFLLEHRDSTARFVRASALPG